MHHNMACTVTPALENFGTRFAYSMLVYIFYLVRTLGDGQIYALGYHIEFAFE